MASAKEISLHFLRRRHAALLAAFVIAWAAPLAGQTTQPVGQLEGGDVAVRGPSTTLRQDGRNVTVLFGGSEVTVRSGYARILLTEGGEIGVCGPAQFSLLKSGGSLTIALSSGRLHARVDAALPFSFYTPLLVAAPLAIGRGAREAVFGIETSGAACVLAARGAVRLEQQFTGHTLVVPERAEVVLTDGQLDSLREARGICRCDAPIASAPAPAAPRQPDVAVATAKAAPENKDSEKKPEPKPPAREEPVWKVVMPPLTFDAAAASPPPEPSPETILLVREVRVRPSVIFTGRVEPPAPKAERAKAEPKPETPSAAPAEKPKRGVFASIGRFFGRLFGKKPKEPQENPAD